MYEKLGAHCLEVDDEKGVYFAVWAPAARSVSVIGDFNFWLAGADVLFPRQDNSGIWEGFIPRLQTAAKYKYHIESRAGGPPIEKGDPFAFYWENPPRTASVIWEDDYEWQDKGWMAVRGQKQQLDQPFSIYELHLGSWKRGNNNELLTYTELAEQLVDYVATMGYTHVELLPVMEHPFYGSWGYQLTGYFAPTARYGRPDAFKALVDRFHQAGIGVILDWVPSHFPSDGHGLAFFDGTHLYEHPDPQKGYHPDWKSYIFNYDRTEVRSFLLSSAHFWLDRYHIDGLRVDGVASMLYLDYSRQSGEWTPNEHGGRENLGAIQLLQAFNTAVYRDFPDVVTIAEESTAWPLVTRPVSVGGLGFGMKWMMGWMQDSLKYFREDPLFRPFHHDKITFSLLYAFSENFVLPYSHDEVVHGKGAMLMKMPGDEWQKFANLRLLYAYMFTHPGAKMHFMGSEFAQLREWDHESSLDWHLLDLKPHLGIQHLLKALNKIYRSEPALHALQFSDKGFEWIDGSDRDNSVLVYVRLANEGNEKLLVVLNLTPVVRHNFRIGLPADGNYTCILNTDAAIYGGTGSQYANLVAEPVRHHWKDHSTTLDLPPLALLVFKYEANTSLAKERKSVSIKSVKSQLSKQHTVKKQGKTKSI
jgi:1,4-alpha-glucan branching enzyme